MMNLTNRRNTVDPVRDLFSAVIGDVTNCRPGYPAKGRMALDIVEYEGGFEIQASVPGYTRDELTIDLERGVLSISAKPVDESEDSGRNEGEGGGCCGGGKPKAGTHLRRERFAGTLSRTVRLPDNIDEDGLTAGLEHGVLTVTVPKVALPEARRIEIA